MALKEISKIGIGRTAIDFKVVESTSRILGILSKKYSAEVIPENFKVDLIIALQRASKIERTENSIINSIKFSKLIQEISFPEEEIFEKLNERLQRGDYYKCLK